MGNFQNVDMLVSTVGAGFRLGPSPISDKDFVNVVYTHECNS